MDIFEKTMDPIRSRWHSSVGSEKSHILSTECPLVAAESVRGAAVSSKVISDCQSQPLQRLEN